MWLPSSAHTDQPWRIHRIAPDFTLEDVWALPTPGGPDDFPRLIELNTRMDPAEGPRVAGALFALRWKLGELFGWDDDGEGLGSRVWTLRNRLPPDLRDTVGADDFSSGLPFVPLYRTDNEFAAEIANRTMHGVMHLSWVPDGDHYRGQMAVLVKRNGIFGHLYMAAIMPFRHLLVYPALLRSLERAWSRNLVG